MVGDAPGIILAVPLLYFLGRRYALITSQLFFMVTMLVKEYFHEQQTALKYHLRLPEQFLCIIVLHGCVRTYIMVTIVYVVEVAQPSHRGPLLAAFFPFFLIGIYWGRFSLGKSHTMLYALIAQTGSFLLTLVAPESPYWQARKGNNDGAYATFRHLRAGDDDADELAALLESASPDAEHPPLLVMFGSALAKMVFLYMGTDSVCHIFMSYLTSPLYFFRYDNTFEHETDNVASPRTMHMYPIFGSLAFLLVCPFLGRRILYLISILVTLLIFYVRQKHITFDMETARMRSAEFCYFASHMGAKQVVLLLSGEVRFFLPTLFYVRNTT